MRVLCLCFTVIITFFPVLSQTEKGNTGATWNIDDLSAIGGYPVTVFGHPTVKEFPDGKAMVFNGVDDGLIVQGCPLNKSADFTIEIIFKPDVSFPNNVEQRYLHIQKPGAENRRMLLELRLNDKNEWFIDTHIRADSAKLTSLAKDYSHPVGRWYHIAFVYSHGTAEHYINGVKEMSGHINYIPVDSACVSLGMRMDHRSYFKGAIKTVRLTPRALSQSEFLSFTSPAPNAGSRSDELFFADDFEKQDSNWVAECEQPATSSVSVKNGRLDINTSAGATVWCTQKLSGSIKITYDAIVTDDGGANDRVSDLNMFWMAADPKNDNLFTRSGKFTAYDDLNLYYAGIGGHDNTTTRFRKYQSTGEKPVLKEYIDKEHLLKGNTLYKAAIIVQDGRTRCYLNDVLYFDYTDAQPYTEGYFGFRTTTSHQLMDNFKIYRLSKE